MTNEHTSLEKYTSHTLFERVAKGLCVRDELETEKTATYWPQVPLSLAALLSHSAGCSTGSPEGKALCRELVLTASNCNSNFNCNWLQLTQLSAAPGYIIVWRPPASYERRICTEFNPSTVKVISWYLRPDVLVSRLPAESKVNMLRIYIYIQNNPKKHIHTHREITLSEIGNHSNTHIHTHTHTHNVSNIKGKLGIK